METKQILDYHQTIGKTISSIEVTKTDYNFIFFTDNTWCLLENGYYVKENYFSSEYPYVKSNDWRNIFVESGISPKNREEIKLNSLGQKLVDLGEISRDEIINSWIENSRQRLESRLLVAITNRNMALEINHDELVKVAKEKLDNFKNIFG